MKFHTGRRYRLAVDDVATRRVEFSTIDDRFLLQPMKKRALTSFHTPTHTHKKKQLCIDIRSKLPLNSIEKPDHTRFPSMANPHQKDMMND